MQSMDSTYSMNGQPFIIVNSDTVTDVSQSFADMTEHSADELLNKNIEEVFKTLRVGPNVDIENIDEESDYFLFTKSLVVRFVNIKVVKQQDKELYIFIEKSGSRLDDKLIFVEQIFIDNVIGAAIFSAPDLILLKANQKYLDFMDAPFNKKENSIGKPIREIVTGFVGTQAEVIWNTVLETQKTSYVKENRHDKFSRGITYWDSSQTPVFENGKMKYIFETAAEVTERVFNRKKIEEQMEEINLKNKQMEAIFESIPSGVFINCKDGRILQQNGIIEKLFYESNNFKVLGDSYKTTKYSTIDGQPLPLERTPAYRALKGEKVKNERIIAIQPDKEIILEISSSPVYDDEDNILMSVTSVHDVTELINNEKVIRNQKELLEAILENMQEGIIVFDKDGKYIITNRAARELFKTTLSKVGDSDKAVEFYDVEGNKVPVEETPNFRARLGETVKDKIVGFKLGGQEFYSILSGTPIFDEKGDLLYGVVSGRDITDFMHNQQALRDAQIQLLKVEHEKNEVLEKAMEMKDEFLSLISHEFRTPINVINTAIQTLNFICADELSDKVKEYIGTIRQNTFRQLRLVNNLLDITRANAGRIKMNKKNVDIVFLTKAITESVYQFASHKGVRITFVSSFGKKIIGIDDEKYERILLNLLSNAIKFTSEGKSIVVNLRTIKNSICVEVKDNGIGIPPNKIDIIFERFGQVDSSLSRRAEGTGLGLSLVKKFVEALGGSISVRSKVGKGSTFTILLPNEKVIEEYNEKPMVDLLDNRLVQTTNVEFSDIYL